MMKIRQRLIVITGVTRGTGRAMADGFIDRGHIVCGCGRFVDALAELQNEYPGPHLFDNVDVSDATQVSDWADRILAQHGPPDLLVNNAGTINAPAPLWRIGDGDFRKVIDVNIVGTVNVIRAFVPAMVERRSGVVVNVSSGWGRSTAPEVAPYCASKYAIEGLTQSLSQELPHGMAAVALNPGVIDTDMLRTVWGDDAASFPTPSEWVQRAVPFLLALGPTDNGRSQSIE
jgi:NAD(P)-dependent dehydrogenase (short-subunit alcohol dehydrogenase family)